VLRSLAPATVRTGARRIDPSHCTALHAEEHQFVRRAVPKRRNEFATGRLLLRELLDHDGVIGVAPSRAPSWPAGTRGSLAHDRHHAVAAVTRDHRISAIGIDIEPSYELSSELAGAILRPEERAMDAHLVFALKEAAYKAWSSLGGRMLEHHDVVVSTEGGRFEARIVDDDVAYHGSFSTVCDSTVALVIVQAEDQQ